MAGNTSTLRAQRRERSKRVGLARALSKLGYCSRSNAAELIRAGRVQLNGATLRDPETPVDMKSARIDVDGHAVAARETIYLMLNKPRGLVTTTSDEKGRDTVYSCLDNSLPWVAPVGRLDKASEGLLLLTNDSEWAARISAPESHLPKTYHVQIGPLTAKTNNAVAALLGSLSAGVRAPRGDLLRVRSARLLRQGEKNMWLEIVLEEGKNRHIRRMLDELGIEVLRLVRVAIGPLALGDLAKGSSRPLISGEKLALESAMRRAI